MTSNEKSPKAQESELIQSIQSVQLSEDPPVDEALEEFRKEWKKEVESRKPGQPSSSTGSHDTAQRIEKKGSNKLKIDRQIEEVTEKLITHDQEDPEVFVIPRKPPSARTVAKKEDAVTLYSRAVESEQSGRLNEALVLYRRAFKLDDNVDRLYARSSLADTSTAQAESLPQTSSGSGFSFQRHIQTAPDYEKAPTTTSTSRRSPLSALIQKLPISPDQTSFLPMDENRPIHISSIPPELIDGILSHLQVADIERFAQVCWRSRCLTAHAPIWKSIATGIYKNPSMLRDGKVDELVKRHQGEWRTTLIEEERIRMDGCYISVCHYVRPGAGEQWVTVTHMITYHRFLRFYPDGKVISFLTTDHPSEVVPLLRPSLRGKGLHFGSWRLIRSDQIDPAPSESFHAVKEKPRAKILISDLSEPGVEEHKYEFEMELGLRETGRGKWNKLDIQRYSSINLSNGETLALSLKHQKPFYFSKVLSYQPQL